MDSVGRGSGALVFESTPNELDWRLDIRMNAFFNGTGVRGIFEPLLILRAGCARNSDRDNQAIDFSRWSAAHFLLDCRRRSGEIHIQSSGKDAHCGQHARTEGCSYEIGRRETLSPPLIIDRRICSQLGFGRTMHGRAVEVTLIFRLNANHASIFAPKEKQRDSGRHHSLAGAACALAWL